MRRIFVVLAAMALAVGMLTPASANRGAETETEDVLGQMLNEAGEADLEDGERELYAADAATIRRTDNGIQVRVNMPTPEPGSYVYPEPGGTVAEEGHPEGFTLWVFIFDDEQGPYGDFPWSTVFLGAGHMVGGSTLTLSGNVSTSHEPFAGFPLENPRDVEVHLAVAPHGGLDPDLMPEQIQTPGGTPAHWWVALFDD